MPGKHQIQFEIGDRVKVLMCDFLKSRNPRNPRSGVVVGHLPPKRMRSKMQNRYVVEIDGQRCPVNHRDMRKLLQCELM